MDNKLGDKMHLIVMYAFCHYLCLTDIDLKNKNLPKLFCVILRTKEMKGTSSFSIKDINSFFFSKSCFLNLSLVSYLVRVELNQS